MGRLIGGAVVACLAAGATAARADFEVQGLVIATVLVGATAIGKPTPSEPSYAAFEVGRFDAIKNVDPATSFGAEYRFGKLLAWKLRPFVGADFTTDHSFYGYGGIRFSAYWGDRLIVTPSLAFGGYSPGDGKSLGNPAVIGRFGLDLEYSLDNEMRVGVAYHHMSNGKILLQNTNPGTEIIGLTFSIALH
jgi:hypothetical protein